MTKENYNSYDDSVVILAGEQVGSILTPIVTKELSSGARVVYIPQEQIATFNQLINRAMATWERAPVSIREFADYFRDGELRIDYKNVEVYKRNEEYSNAQGHQSTEATRS